MYGNEKILTLKRKRNLQFVDGSQQEDNIVIHEPTEYFSKFLDQSMLDKIVEELNKYAIQKNPDKLTNSELEQFIGILYVMSLVKIPSSRMYWSKEFIFEKVAQAISVNRFEHIKNSLHINDNQSCPENCADKLYKLRPLIDYLKKTFNEIKPMEKLCIDEKIVPFKGKSALKQYNPQKPKKWEYKLYILSGVDGLIILKFILELSRSAPISQI